MHRFTTPVAALAVASALLLAGCASGGSSDPTPEAGSCDAIKVEVRNISNGAQNTIATATDPDEATTALEGYSERVTALEDAATDDAVSAALDDFNASIEDAMSYAGSIPTDPDAEVDADALASAQEGVQSAASKVTEACAAE